MALPVLFPFLAFIIVVNFLFVVKRIAVLGLLVELLAIELLLFASPILTAESP